ncbi:outer membrane beta-barrel protein [Sphingobacterium hungaricum]
MMKSHSKISIFTFLLTIGFFYTQAQVVGKKNGVSLNYGISSSIYTNQSIGVPGVEGYAHNFGLHYNRYFSMGLSFETGVRYSQNSMDVSGTDGDGNRFEYNGKSSFIHVPILVEYEFLTYLFAQLGPTVSIQLNNDIRNESNNEVMEMNQSGVGIWGAFGAKFGIKNYELRVYPYYHAQSLIPFGSDDTNYTLKNAGGNVSFAYKF